MENPSTSPLKTLFDSSQLSGSINVQDGGTTSFPKTIHGSRPKIRLLCRLKRSQRYRLSNCTCYYNFFNLKFMEVGPDGAYGQLVPNPVDLEHKRDHEAARNRGLNMAGKCVQER